MQKRSTLKRFPVKPIKYKPYAQMIFDNGFTQLIPTPFITCQLDDKNQPVYFLDAQVPLPKKYWTKRFTLGNIRFQITYYDKLNECFGAIGRQFR